jgi:chromosome segregation ATPase
MPAVARCQVLSEETSTISEAETLIMEADSPEALILDLLKAMEEKSKMIASALEQTEELARTVDQKDLMFQEVMVELTTAREEMDAAELVMNDLTNARNEIVSLKAELATVKAEKVTLEEMSRKDRAAKLELQSQLDAALVKSKENQEALKEALARIDELVAVKTGNGAAIKAIPGVIKSAAKGVVGAVASVRGASAGGKTDAPKANDAANPAALVGQRIMFQGFRVPRYLQGEQGVVIQWLPSNGKCLVRVDGSNGYTPPVTIDAKCLKRI